MGCQLAVLCQIQCVRFRIRKKEVNKKKKRKAEQHTWYPQIQNNRHRFFRYQPLSNTSSSRTLIRSNRRCVKGWSLLSVYLPIYKSTLAVIWIWPVFETCLIYCEMGEVRKRNDLPSVLKLSPLPWNISLGVSVKDEIACCLDWFSPINIWITNLPRQKKKKRKTHTALPLYVFALVVVSFQFT